VRYRILGSKIIIDDEFAHKVLPELLTVGQHSGNKKERFRIVDFGFRNLAVRKSFRIGKFEALIH
jgi:hypothetical protein